MANYEHNFEAGHGIICVIRELTSPHFQVRGDVEDDELSNVDSSHSVETFSETKNEVEDEERGLNAAVEGLVEEVKLKNSEVVLEEVFEKEEPGTDL